MAQSGTSFLEWSAAGAPRIHRKECAHDLSTLGTPRCHPHGPGRAGRHRRRHPRRDGRPAGSDPRPALRHVQPGHGQLQRRQRHRPPERRQLGRQRVRVPRPELRAGGGAERQHRHLHLDDLAQQRARGGVGHGTQAEFGTEHGIATLSTDQSQAAGFNGRVTNFDLSINDNDGDPCTAQGFNRSVYYASGNQDTANNCSPGAPGNFNTHGGASTGAHFRGIYGTTVYQDEDTNNVQSQCNQSLGSANMCFEGVINGFTN